MIIFLQSIGLEKKDRNKKVNSEQLSNIQQLYSECFIGRLRPYFVTCFAFVIKYNIGPTFLVSSPSGIFVTNITNYKTLKTYQTLQGNFSLIHYSGRSKGVVWCEGPPS